MWGGDIIASSLEEKDLLRAFKADKIVLYKHSKGTKWEEIDFVEFENVPVILGPDSISVYQEGKVSVFPSERLYEATFSGKFVEWSLKVGSAQMRQILKQVEDLERLPS